MKCAPSSYVLTAQPISGGGLSLSGNSRNMVKTGAMAFFSMERNYKRLVLGFD
jgi:hypothetical protein